MVDKEITKEDINQTGYSLLNKPSRLSKDQANSILKDFRVYHQKPMTLFRQLIERKTLKHNLNTIVSQRLKRIPSIVKKLKLQKNMKLSRMQDIAGIRVVVDNIDEVYLIRNELKRVEAHGNFKFTFVNEKDYISKPASSGYRSLHLIYKYEKKVPKNKQCLLEIQIRTKMHHSWATAVEVVGTYTNQPLKQSLGEEVWLSIFRRISKLFINLEDLKVDAKEVNLLKETINRVNFFDILDSCKIITDHLSAKRNLGRYLLMGLTPNI